MGGLIVSDNDNPTSTICRGFRQDDVDFPNWEANARRIVAAVNAAEGFTTEELESGAIERLWTTVKQANEVDRVYQQEAGRLKAQNVQLLETLKWTTRNLQEASTLTDNEGADYEDVYAPVINAAHAAIVAAEKTPTS